MANADTVAINRISDSAGEVCVHFPRSGYQIKSCKQQPSAVDPKSTLALRRFALQSTAEARTAEARTAEARTAEARTAEARTAEARTAAASIAN